MACGEKETGGTKSKSQWHASPVDDNAQSSQDQWKNSTLKNEWKEVSREFHELASTLKEKSHTWNKSCKDSAKREGDILKLAEMAGQDEKQEDEERRDIKKALQTIAQRQERRR